MVGLRRAEKYHETLQKESSSEEGRVEIQALTSSEHWEGTRQTHREQF